MSFPDAPFKQVVTTFFEECNLSVEEIEISSSKTPDLLINKSCLDATLLEIKTKEDDPKFMEELNDGLDSGEVCSYSLPTNYWNRLDGIISSGVKQLNEIDPSIKLLRIIWMHCTGYHADLVEMRLKATIYGTQNLFCTKRPNIVSCFYFWNSSFFKHRKYLDAVIISRGDDAQINLNDKSERFERIKNSGVCKAFQKGVFYPQQYFDDQDHMYCDSMEQRDDVNVTLGYLRSKYGLSEIQTIDLGMHAGVMRVPES